MNKIIIRIISFSAAILALPCISMAQDKVEYGREILLGKEQSTVAVSSVGADKLEHKLTNDATNSLFGLLPGLQVMQNAGTEWNICQRSCYA